MPLQLEPRQCHTKRARRRLDRRAALREIARQLIDGPPRKTPGFETFIVGSRQRQARSLEPSPQAFPSVRGRRRDRRRKDPGEDGAGPAVPGSASRAAYRCGPSRPTPAPPMGSPQALQRRRDQCRRCRWANAHPANPLEINNDRGPVHPGSRFVGHDSLGKHRSRQFAPEITSPGVDQARCNIVRPRNFADAGARRKGFAENPDGLPCSSAGAAPAPNRDLTQRTLLKHVLKDVFKDGCYLSAQGGRHRRDTRSRGLRA